jgi:signal transduction histidine kinase
VSLRPRWLAAAGSADATDADGRSALGTLAALLVPAHADACFIDVTCRNGAGLQRVVAVSGRGNGEISATRDGADAAPAELSIEDSAAADAIASGRSVRFHGADVVDRLGGGDAERRVLDAVAPTAALVVPMRARGATLGTLTLLRSAPDARFTDDEVDDVEELALQAALLLGNLRLERRAATAQRARSEFLAIVSHELRTPLNIILGYAELMLSGIPEPLLPRSAHQVERMRTSARYLLQRIEEVLTYARLEGRRERVRPQRIELDALLREAVELVEPLAEAKSLALRSTPATGVQLVSDATHLRQILLHLLTNAVRFTDRGSVSVAVDTDSADDTVAITIADTGRGMSPEQIAHVFEPFWQADPLETRRAHGTGLGLSLAGRLAELLGGRISCRSEPGRGSSFTLHLPLSRPER